LLSRGEPRIVELGSGTGKFAVLAAQDPAVFVVASEYDQRTHQWCIEHVAKQANMVFLNGPIPPEFGAFSLSVAIEVVEHVSDFVGFLTQLRALAPRSLITTPNRRRSASDNHSGPPTYFKHVREWTAGEFYWVLRSFWDDVRLYALTSQTHPTYIKVHVDTVLSPLVADCRSPLSQPRG
jgi:cyclopropane fatty-acyl-phospholipid synthase-like methyltransferase